MSRRGAVLEGIEFKGLDVSPMIEAAKINQRSQEFAADMKLKKGQQKEKQGKDATDFITGLKNEYTGVNDIDVENDKQLLAEKEKMTQMQLQGKSLQEIQTYAMRALPKINNAYLLGKNYSAQVATGLTDLEKKYGDSVDIKAARNKANENLANDIFDRDASGKIIGYKDVDLIPKNRNYLNEIENDPNSLGTVFKPNGALADHVKGLKTTTISGGEKIRDKRGVENDYKLSGTASIFSQPVKDENGKTIGKEIKYEDIPTGKDETGKIIYTKALPKEEYDVFIGKPAAEKEWNIILNKHLEEDLGINPKALDPRAKEVYGRIYAREFIDQTNIDGSSLYTETVQKQPIPRNVTNVRVNSGTPATAIDVYNPIVSYLDGRKDLGYKTVEGTMVNDIMQGNALDDKQLPVIMDLARSASKSQDLDINSIYLKREPDGSIYIMEAAEPNKISTTKDKPLQKLTETGVNTRANQPYGVKPKIEAAKKGEGNKGDTKAKTFDVINPNTGQVIMKGVDENQANKAKAKGYKIQ